MNADKSRRSDPPREIAMVAAKWLMRVDAGLSPAEAAEMNRWLGEDDAHRAAYERCTRAWGRLDVPEEGGKVDQLILELGRRSRRRRHSRYRWSGAIAPLIIFGAALLWWSHPGSAPSFPSVPATARMIQPQRQILPDGSVAELNVGAQIQIDYTGAIRRVVVLAGEAHFEVMSDAARPFHVVAGGVDVRAVGTAFSVQREPSAVVVLVSHGRVAVTRPREAESEVERGGSALRTEVAATTTNLGVGERLVIPQTHKTDFLHVERLQPDELEVLLAWRTPAAELSGTPLAEALRLLEQHGHGRVRFVLAQPDLAEVRVSGVFRLNRTEAFVRLLEQGFGIKAETRSDGAVVLSRAR